MFSQNYSQNEILMIVGHVIFIILTLVIWYNIYIKLTDKKSKKISIASMIYLIAFMIFILACYLLKLKIRKTEDFEEQNRLQKKFNILVIFTLVFASPIILLFLAKR